jgi:hypothetical protein
MAAWIVFMLWLPPPAAQAQARVVSVVQPYNDEASESGAVFAASVGVPPNVSVPAEYEDLLDAMLRSSPTFRAQCTRIARANQLRITVRRSLFAAPQAALTNLTRNEDGRIDAEVEVGLFGDVTLLVAHEFEHILEQLDGVDLVGMANRPGTGVHADPRTGQFETERAIAIGRRVAKEVSRATARR